MFGTANTLIKSVKVSSTYMIIGLANMLAFFACQSSGNGPCDWHPEEYVKMEVVKIEPTDETGENFEVWLEFNKSILGKETQRMSEIRGHAITREFLEINNISKGLIYTGYVNELKEGDCDPYYVSFEAGLKMPKE